MDSTKYTYAEFKKTSSGFWQEPFRKYAYTFNSSRHNHRKKLCKPNLAVREKREDRTHTIHFHPVRKKKKVLLPRNRQTCLITNPTWNKRYLFHSKILMDGPEDIQCCSGLQKVPVYIEYNKTFHLLNTADPSRLRKEISTLLKIPKRLLLLFHNGKCISNHRIDGFEDVQPYDTVTVIIKGKGGMQDSDSIHTVVETSTEQEVSSWLLDVVRVSKENIEKYGLDDLDGRVLKLYSIQNIEKFTELFPGVPIGLLRRIILLKDSTNKTKMISTLEESKWSSEDVVQFVQTNIKRKESADEICDFIRKQEIDGLVLLSYDEGDMMKDYDSSANQHPLQFKKIYLASQNILKDHQILQLTQPETKNDGHRINDDTKKINEVDQSNGTKASNSDYQASQPELKQSSPITVLFEKLNLSKLAEDIVAKDVQNCKFNIIYSAIEHRNELEKQVTFLVLSEKDKVYSSDEAIRLWNEICQNLKVWRDSFDKKSKKNFKNSESADVLLFKERKIKLSTETPKMSSLDVKQNFHKELLGVRSLILLVDCECKMSLDTNFSVSLHLEDDKSTDMLFSVPSSTKFWLFDIKQQSKNFWKQGKDVLSSDCSIPERTDRFCGIQRNRPFLASSEEVQYSAGSKLNSCESEGRLHNRCFEYKLFSTSEVKLEKALAKFLLETMRFACGVMNSRKNGTIAFGIGDDVGEVEGKSYQHGEIVGCKFEHSTTDVRTKFTDALNDAKKNCFEQVYQDKAILCVGDPVFIPVYKPGNAQVVYVIEVDIEPSTIRCEGAHFRINRSLLKDVGNIKKIEKDFTLYVRDGASTKKLDHGQEKNFKLGDLKKHILERQEYDGKHNNPTRSQLERPMMKLERLLCNGLDQFDSSFYPLLFLSKPTKKQKENTEWIESLRFVKSIDFYCIFDFDDFSNEDGLCKQYSHRYKLYSDTLFENFNVQSVQAQIGFPHDPNGIWLFSNGRSDVKRPHSNRNTWKENYIGVKDAVLFYSQMIPPRRAICIFLLFMDDFAGIIEILEECIGRFGWDRIIIISPDESIFNILKKIMVGEQRCSDKDINRRSVFGDGITWEKICFTINKLTGNEEVGKDYIPSYSGGDVQVDKKFLEAIPDLEILSTDMCDSPIEINSPFQLQVEKQFYKGGRVSWFNFAYGHVCERSILLGIKEYIERIVNGNSHQNNDPLVYYISVHCQPGAGASTLARHILWEFRKKIRCAIVKRITDKTVWEIMSLWLYKEKSSKNPVLLLIDEESMIVPYQLHSKFKKHFADNSALSRNGPVCCIINVVCRNDKEAVSHSDYTSFQSHEYNVSLQQKLTDKEKSWFDEKYRQMEKRKDSYSPDTLIAFLILRKDFDEKFLQEKIRDLMKAFKTSENELKLLSYVALLSHYANRSNFTRRAFLPVDCCDELIGTKFGKTNDWKVWEKSLDNDKRIFLIIEENRNYNFHFKFKEVRLSHPKLANIVLDVLQETFSNSLSEITLSFLHSSVLKSRSNCQTNDILNNKTKDMLTRRLKEEYNDNCTTEFSPLIEEIIKTEGYEKAIEVLEVGATLYPLYTFCTIISKVLSNVKQFDEAIKWAKSAQDFAQSTEDIGFCKLSLGLVFYRKFDEHYKDDLENETSSKRFHELLFPALELFIEARKEIATTGDISVLHVTHYIVRAVILFGKFIMEVHFPSAVDRKRLLTDPNYMPFSLPAMWEGIQDKGCIFVRRGQEAFEIIQRMICFEPIYYSHKPNLLHRLHRRLKSQYPTLLHDFLQMFAADSDKPECTEMPEVEDEWHRRKVMGYMGNNYMDLYNRIYLQVKKGAMETDRAVELCYEIKGHLSFIKEMQHRDHINKVAVTILLSSLNVTDKSNRRSHNTPIKELIGHCDLVSKSGDQFADQAYFFLSMLLWPCGDHDKNYNDELFYKTLEHFRRRWNILRQKQKKQDSKETRGDKNFSIASPQFFLREGVNLQKLCHRFDIYNSPNGQKFEEDKFWYRKDVCRKVKRVEGIIQHIGTKKYISLENTMNPDKDIQVHSLRRSAVDSDERVTFVLGFSIAGPIAFDIRSKNRSDDPYPNLDDSLHDRTEQYSSQPTTQLIQLQANISELKMKTRLTRPEQALLEDEGIIKEILELRKDDTLW